MSINWQELLTTVGGGAGLVFAAAWVVKSILTHQLTKDVEKYRMQLQANTNIEVERLRSSLQIAAFEHQTRFSNLHEKRAE